MACDGTRALNTSLMINENQGDTKVRFTTVKHRIYQKLLNYYTSTSSKIPQLQDEDQENCHDDESRQLPMAMRKENKLLKSQTSPSDIMRHEIDLINWLSWYRIATMILLCVVTLLTWCLESYVREICNYLEKFKSKWNITSRCAEDSKDSDHCGDKPICTKRAVDKRHSDKHYMEFCNTKQPSIGYATTKSFVNNSDRLTERSVNESTYGSSAYYTGGGADYSQYTYKSRIVGAGNVSTSVNIKRANLYGVESKPDNGYDTDQAAEHATDTTRFTSSCVTGGSLSTNDSGIGSVNIKCSNLLGVPSVPDRRIDSIQASHQKLVNSSNGHPPHHQNSGHYHNHWDDKVSLKKDKPDDEPLLEPESKSVYNKPTYAVLVGNTVKVYSTNMFASLPDHGKFMVKERQRDASGSTKVKLALKSFTNNNYSPTSDENERDGAVKAIETDEVGERLHFRGNSKSTGYIIYTCDRRFTGNVKYPLPTGRATDSKIGKGGNGFVFTIYHERKQYAVKKTVYRSNEVNVHSSLNHKNILPLLAVLMGERHERHSGRHYCFHFMPKMDYDLRQILSSREVGCLKHFYNHCSKDVEKWHTGFNNIKFILAGTLEALTYLHANGYVHRDVKASNIMIKMQCRCQPLSCRCSSKFQVKLGDFDSAGTVPGLGIKEPTDQMIKFASILPLGTPGYRAPEVSMHITLSGPYETLYTFAVDMWSFGCLCLNICIGKTAALKQREEASLLLSRTHSCGKELWEKTTKIKELENTKPFSSEKEFLKLISSCLQVNGDARPTAPSALKIFNQHLLINC